LKKIFFFFEELLFDPKIYHYPIIIPLIPISGLYTIFTFLNAFQKHLKREKFPVKVVGVGNLVLGGSGKTPLTIALAQSEKKAVIVLRGYGRKSVGRTLISKWGKILENVSISGDEAMLYAKSLPNASVIVSENRTSGIELGIELGGEIIFLDDSFRQHQIEKDIEYLIVSKPKNPFLLPAGGYREKLWFFKNVKKLEEGKEFFRKVSLENRTEKMVLVTAISKPERLEKYLESAIPKHYFPDHYTFSKDELLQILEDESATSILTTEKDFVKMENFNLPISLLKLEIYFEK
jgi:tetraacyldisaccharide 4'-kinase